MEFLLGVFQATIALIIIIDPLGLVPIFLALTPGCSVEERRSIFARAAIVGFLLLLLFTFTGTGILSLFRISISDFKIAGGILLLVLALRIVDEAHYGTTSGGRAGVVPLAVPLLIGPGAITTTIVFIGQYGLWVVFVSVLITFAFSFLILWNVNLLFRYLGKTGSDVIAKVMGMLLAAIAIQFIRQGIFEVFNI